MALTYSEQQELKQLEAMATARVPSSGLTASEQQELAQLESLAAPKMSNVEAELGIIDRARYALEPIDSNREALLKQQFGSENVIRDNKGELRVLQEGAYRPANAAGLGMTDVAEFAGALPEMIPEAIGGMMGGTAGLAVGAPTGPGAVATGALGLAGGRAVGGALGSGLRQVLSAAVGTPQVATPSERAMEVGMSAVAAPIGGALADAAAPVIKSIPGIRSFFQPKQAAQEVAQEVAPQVGKELVSQAIPGADQFSRPMVQQEYERLSKIATEQGLPPPTYAQAASGKAILAEQQLMDTPIVGTKIRNRVDKQLQAVKDNLENVVGKFLDIDHDPFENGATVKAMSSMMTDARKQTASSMYQAVDELGANAKVGKATFFNKYRDFAAEYNMITPNGARTKYTADIGLTPTEFKTLQDALFQGMDAIKRSKSPTVPFASVDALRRTVKGLAEEGEGSNTSRILYKFVDQLEDTSQRILNREHPRLAEVFKGGRKEWATYKDYQAFIKEVMPDGDNEAVFVKRIMSNPNHVLKLKEMIGEDRVKEMAVTHVGEILKEKLSGAGVARATAAINSLKKIRQPIVDAMGEKAYSNLIKNLDYLNKTNQPLVPNRASLYSLFSDTTGGLKGFAARVVGAGRAAVESGNLKPSDIGKSIGRKVSKIPTGPISRSNIGNILTTQKQTEANR